MAIYLRLVCLLNLEDSTTYKNAHSAVDENPENACKCLKKLVGAKGFEPSTSWSRTRRASQAALRPDNRHTQQIIRLRRTKE
jgi:hypothetical protein